MGLIERLEAKRRELDREVLHSLRGEYHVWYADMRDLLDEAIRELKRKRWIAEPNVFTLTNQGTCYR